MEVAETILIWLGCALSLPIYWWLLTAPLTALVSQYRARKAAGKQLPFLRD
jgi:type II secretory pathway component PulM